MKKIIFKIFLWFILFQSLFLTSQSQEVLHGVKQIFDITMDDIGNATVEVSMTLNAAQWDGYKRNVGNNTSILKREMEKALPKYYLSDFNYTEDQMERSYKMKFKVLGLSVLNSNGNWVSDLESKNPDVTKLSDREFVMTQDINNNGMLIQQTQKLHLPSNASGAKIEKDSFGKAVMTYSTGSGWMPRIITYGGILLALAGCWMFYNNQQAPKNNLRVAKDSIAA